eukprot:10348768-Ditylum_brightwellii.AAC.1
MPTGERSLWVRLTSEKLKANGKAPTDFQEMDLFIAPKKGGLCCAFEKRSDGLFPAPDLGKFGLEHWCFKELLSHWTFAEVPNG